MFVCIICMCIYIYMYTCNNYSNWQQDTRETKKHGVLVPLKRPSPSVEEFLLVGEGTKEHNAMPGVEASFTLLDRIPLSWWLMEGLICIIHVGKNHMWPYRTIGNVLVEVKNGFHNSFKVISKIVRVISQQVWIPQLFAHVCGQQLTSCSMEPRAENFKVQVVGNSMSESKTAQKIWRTIQLLKESQKYQICLLTADKKPVSICYGGPVYDTKRQAVWTRQLEITVSCL